MEDSHSADKKKGSFQHKLFKVVILIIVGIFFWFIISFVKIQFFKKDDVDYKFELNHEKYNYLEKIDQYFIYTLEGTINVEECELNNFYFEYVRNSKPCVIKGTNEILDYFKKIKNILQTELVSDIKKLSLKNQPVNLQGLISKIGMLDFADVFELPNLFLRFNDEDSLNKSNKEKQKAKANNKDYLLLQISGERKIALAPISQINKLTPRREYIDQTNILKFNTIQIKEDLFNLENDARRNIKDKSKLILLTALLKEGEMLYIPSYFFVQEKITELAITDLMPNQSIEMSLQFEFLSNMRILNTMYKVLFDDNMDLKEQNDN